MKIQDLNFSVDLMQAILWQYNDAENLQSVISQKENWYQENYEQFWINWVRDVFDIRTANSFGLTVWSIILQVPIIVLSQEPAAEDIPFGFDDTDSNFENSNFKRYAGEAQELSVEQARLVILMRYNQLISDGSVPHTNEFLERLFGDSGGAYVIDNNDMTINYVFKFQPPARLWYIIKNYDILPRPAGVKIAAIQVVPKIPFGFDLFNNNFDQGNFAK